MTDEYGEVFAVIAGVLTWAISAFAICVRVTGVVGAEQPMLTAIVLVVGILVTAIAPALIVYALAR